MLYHLPDDAGVPGGEYTGMPRKILLATDMSFRCDRALDRTLVLAREWGAAVIVAHVMQTSVEMMRQRLEHHAGLRLPSDPLAVMRWQLRRDLGVDIEGSDRNKSGPPAIDPAELDVRVEEGDVVERLLAIAEHEGCDLIVTGIARDEPLGRFLVGTTVNQLVRRASVPVLMVKDRVNRPYRSVAVASDFSASSRHALQVARRLFPTAAMAVLHAAHVPYAGFTDREASGRREEIQRQAEAAFQQAVPPEEREGVTLRVAEADAEHFVAGYVRELMVDLTVVGSHGRGAVFDALIGSMTKRLLDHAASDVLVVIDPAARR